MSVVHGKAIVPAHSIARRAGPIFMNCKVGASKGGTVITALCVARGTWTALLNRLRRRGRFGINGYDP